MKLNNQRNPAFNRVRARTPGLSALAMSFVLPHENRAMRLPVVPATYTALLETMSDGTIPVLDNTTKRGFLCRDPCYPLWIEKTFVNASMYVYSIGSVGSWTLPATANTVILIPQWDQVAGNAAGGATIDGRNASNSMVVDHFVMGDSASPGTQAVYIPPGTRFCCEITTGAATAGTGIQLELVSTIGGEEFPSSVIMTAGANGYYFSGIAGTLTTTIGTLTEGVVPRGFTYIRALRTTATGPNASANPVFALGWGVSQSLSSPAGTVVAMVPFAMPPEFNNSTLPYGRTRLNSSAALLTNVTAALSKEGTILASRLKPSVVDPWEFTESHLNSVHPKLRYFGPLEKGLYTFTSPSGNVDDFTDGWMTMPSNSTYNATQRPLFSYSDIGIYNAFILADLGSAATGTQMAVSCYTHIEFESTSSLFQPGVSTLTLETLHAAEVALLSFGHFHENPLHWAAIRTAAMAALKVVGPMVAPYVQKAGAELLNRGVKYLTGQKPAGDRKMPQDRMNPPRPVRPRAPKRGQKKKK